jgi:hypothetical protein
VQLDAGPFGDHGQELRLAVVVDSGDVPPSKRATGRTADSTLTSLSMKQRGPVAAELEERSPSPGGRAGQSPTGATVRATGRPLLGAVLSSVARGAAQRARDPAAREGKRWSRGGHGGGQAAGGPKRAGQAPYRAAGRCPWHTRPPDAPAARAGSAERGGVQDLVGRGRGGVYGLVVDLRGEFRTRRLHPSTVSSMRGTSPPMDGSPIPRCPTAPPTAMQASRSVLSSGASSRPPAARMPSSSRTREIRRPVSTRSS